MATKRENGEDYPAEAYAYVPDAESPSTWKLRLWDSLAERETAAQIARAVMALSPSGFRGQPVDIPSADLPGVKQRVLDAWLSTHPDSTIDDAPLVLTKSMPMRADGGDGGDDYEIDPLDELLDAYQSFVRMGLGDLADQTMGIVHALQTLMLGVQREMAKSGGMGYGSPVACLAQAYLALVAIPQTRDIATQVLALMDAASSAIWSREEMPDEIPGEMATGDESAGSADAGGRGGVQRVITQEGDQYCVYSETGRTFGCYETRDAAQARLAQIEQFAGMRLGKATASELVTLHEQAHLVPVVTAAVKTVHDLVSDELEVVHGLAEPYTMSMDDKVALIEGDGAMITKAAEYRYTLGPAYVPDREDAHGEFTDTATLQRAMWDWVRKGDRSIYLQHTDRVAGEMVEMMTVPFAMEAEMSLPGGGVTKYQFPADTPFLGVVWEPWAWDLVKRGEVRGYSIGGSAKRIEADLPDAALV